jgi:hypothetical protein
MVMIATEQNELNANDPEWQRYAVRLARRQIPFVVAHLNPALDAPFYEAVKDKYSFEATFNPESDRVFFMPKNLPLDMAVIF